MYTYTPTYYTTFQDSIASLCKSILPFSFKKRRLTAIAAAEQRLSKQQSDNLKWQQDSFHQILNLMGLCKEGILPETEVSAFRANLLETLIASPVDHEQPMIVRDKLIFLQELFYAKCISEEEYHSSKRPLLQRLAVQGAEIDARDVIVGVKKEASDDEWTVIDLKDEQCLPNKEKNKSKQDSAMKQIKGAASVFSFISTRRNGKAREDMGSSDTDEQHFRPNDQKIPSSSSTKSELGLSRENPFWNMHLKEKESESRSILMSESLPPESFKVEKQSKVDSKRKPFRNLFQFEQREGHKFGSDDHGPDYEERAPTLGKKQWGFDGFKKWKKNNLEDETAPSSLGEKSDSETGLGQLAENLNIERPDTKQIKRKMHSNGSHSDFYKVLGENIKIELSQIQAELNARNPNVHFSDDQIEAISTRLPVDKADLKKFFPKSWCDRYGEVVLDVVRKEFKEHVGDSRNLQTAAAREDCSNSNRWPTFEDDENCHPNLFAPRNQSFPTKNGRFTSTKDDGTFTNSSNSTDKCFKYNPFFDN